MECCAREAMHVFGGAGFIRATKVERIYREVRVNAIGGGGEEICATWPPGKSACSRAPARLLAFTRLLASIGVRPLPYTIEDECL